VTTPNRSDDTVAEVPLSYESARDELLAIVRQLEAGGSTLQESIELWERGEQLARRCQEFLEGARRRIIPGDGSTGADG
jgi:exodeoxyribonuclease VII small subunit